jgi:2-polyprenyl-3-methyl-5-hydroxy-6-metoxy-1,4-benzoquinol methylase
MIQVVAALRRGVCLRRSTTGCQPRVPGQCQTTRVDDSYADLAHDYEWLFPDEVIGGGGTVGATSPGSEDFLEGILETLPPGARVLDSACGIGADAMALARRGFDVTASDGSASMVAEARRRCLRFGVEMEITQSSWQDLPERVPGAFELILCLGNSIVHTATKSRMISALAAIRKVLSPDGVLVVDSRNWEYLYESRPRIITGRRVIERHGVRSSSLYIWTIPDDFTAPCRAEIVFLFEDASSAITHRRYVIDFTPFTRADLTAAIHGAGLTVIGDSYQPDNPFYAVAATR